MKHMLRPLISALLLTLGSVAPAHAAEEGKVFGDWKVACEPPLGERKEKLCYITQAVNSKEQKLTMLGIRIGYLLTDGQAAAVATVPLSVFLPGGLLLRTGEEQDALEAHGVFQRCDPNGCHAMIPLEEKHLEALRKGSTAAVFFRGPDTRPMGVPVSLKGFTAGLASLR